MKKLLHGIMIVMICTSCATTEINPKVKNTAIVSVSLYCGVFKNFHRLIMRAVQLIDPTWETICDNELINPPGDPVPSPD